MADSSKTSSDDNREYMLTTLDNPYDPFTKFDEWFEFDESSGYHTTSLLARVTISSNSLSEPDQESAINDAIEEIIKENVSGKHKKIYKK